MGSHRSRRFAAWLLQALGRRRHAAEVLLTPARRSGDPAHVKKFLQAVDRLADASVRSLLVEKLWESREPPAAPGRSGLAGRLIVSLTSYPGRYPTLPYTLRCLLGQSVRADRTILWVATADHASLPASVLAFQAQGLEIRLCHDLRSYNKIVPALREEPAAFIVTADDDVFYPPDWLEQLVHGSARNPDRIITMRARRIELDDRGRPRPYGDWRLARGDGQGPHRPAERPEQLFPTGVGGVLYPPGALQTGDDVWDDVLRLAPHADDVGLYWIWRMNGRLATMVGDKKFSIAVWPGSQQQTLMSVNVDGQQNDEQIKRLIAHFDFPGPTPMQPSIPKIVEITTRQGYRMWVDPADHIGRQLVAQGMYDAASLAVVAPVLEQLKPRTLLDIGANVGNHTLAWAHSCKRLLAFEPGTRAHALLKHNVEANALTNVELLDFGLSEASSTQTLYVRTAGNLGASSLHHREDGAEEESVCLRRGDDYLLARGIGDVDFIKIDVEGHERYAFLGLEQTLGRCRPIVLTEWSAETSDRGWLTDPGLMQRLFPTYDTYALIKNRDRTYWSRRPFGTLRRLLGKMLQQKRRVLMPLAPDQIPPRSTKDLLLVPREKAWCLADNEIFPPASSKPRPGG